MHSKISPCLSGFKNYIVLVAFCTLEFCRFPGLDSSLLQFQTLFGLLQSAENRNQNSSLILGGRVQGLAGSGLQLRLNLNNNPNEVLSIASSGEFSFQQRFRRGGSYAIEVINQPVSPFQECLVAGGVGSFGSEDIRNVIVECEDTGVRPPLFNPNPGNYSTPQTVFLTNQSPGSTIVYTLDGSDPSADCTIGGTTLGYTGSISLAQGTTTEIRTRACFEGESSIVNFGTFTIDLGTLAQPTFDPPPQASTTNLDISIIYPGSEPITIYYSLDTGTIPDCTPNGIEYTGTPITLNSSETILAIACAPGFSPSPWAVGNYSVNEMVVSPVVDVPEGTYNNDLTINLDSGTDGATIVYTLDGSTPDCVGTGTPGSVVNISNNTLSSLRAIACKDGFLPSALLGPVNYTLQVGDLTVTPASGVYQTTQTVTMTSPTSGASILYTTVLGDPPDCNNPGAATTFTSSFNIDTGGNNEDLAIIGCKPGYNPSPPLNREITVNGQLSPPSIEDNTPSPNLITLISNDLIPLTQKICYTTDASNPICSGVENGNSVSTGGQCGSGSLEYGSPITILNSTNLRARICSNGWLQSPIASESITRTGSVGNPVFSVASGTYDNTFEVTISATDADEIWYRTDGGLPDCTGPVGDLYDGPILIELTGTTLQAIGCRSGFTPSPVTTVTYDLKPGPVTFNPSIGGVITSPPVNLTMSTSTDGADIFFKSDGSAPVCGIPGDMYTTPINLTSGDNFNFRAIACRDGFDTSEERDIQFNVTGTLPQPIINKTPVLGLLGLLLGNNVTITASTPPAGQRICYRTGSSGPACSLSDGGVANSLGGFCASGSIEYDGTFGVSSTATVRARTCLANWIQSPVNVD